MRLAVAASIVVGCLASSALAGITVTSYTTTALTNAFSPVGSGQYFQKQTLTNVSPATASVSGDWTGPNADGTPDTWHWLGQSQVTTSTAFDASSLMVTAAGSFAYELDTTASFVDPRSASVFTPAGAADYECHFTFDTATTYTVSVELQQWGKVFLGSVDTGFVFNESNQSPVPRLVQRSGTLPPGNYQIGVNASLGLGNLSPGQHDIQKSGGFSNLNFSLNVPEPGTTSTLIVVALLRTSSRRRGTVCS